MQMSDIHDIVSTKRSALLEALRVAYQLGFSDRAAGQPADAGDKLSSILSLLLNEQKLENKLDAAHLLAVKEGWISKRTLKQKQISSWKRRYIKLTPESIFFYRTDSAVDEPRGKWVLEDIKNVVLCREDHSLRLALTSEQCQYEITCGASDGSVVEWLKAIQTHNPRLKITNDQGDGLKLWSPRSRGSFLQRMQTPKMKRKASEAKSPKGATLAQKVSDRLLWPPVHPQPPLFLRRAFRDLLYRGVPATGIFRVSATREAVAELEFKWKCGQDVVLNHWGVHIVACALKSYLRNLPEPLTTFSSYQPLLDTLKLESARERATTLAVIIKGMPSGNVWVLQELLTLLRQIDANSEHNMMNSHNLAVVFAPSIIGAQDQAGSDALGDLERMQGVVKFMIENDLDQEATIPPSAESEMAQQLIHNIVMMRDGHNDASGEEEQQLGFSISPDVRTCIDLDSTTSSEQE